MQHPDRLQPIGPPVRVHAQPQPQPEAVRVGRVAGLVNPLLDWLGRRVVFLQAGDFVFVTFGLFAALGAATTLLSAGVILIGQGLAPSAFFGLAVASSLAVVSGSWLLAQLLDWRLVLRQPIAALRRPVFVSWGGVLLLPPVFWLVCSLAGFEPLAVLDAAARTLPAGHALGRLGCLSYGCCFGRPTRGALGITYHDPRSKAVRVANLQGIRLHPAALYEAGLDLAIVLVVNTAAALDAPLGMPSALVMVLYGAGRFGIEFLKDNRDRFVVGSLAINHFVSAALVCAGLLLLCLLVADPHTTTGVAWPQGFAQVLKLLPAMLPAVGVVFVGFSLHRRRIGTW